MADKSEAPTSAKAAPNPPSSSTTTAPSTATTARIPKIPQDLVPSQAVSSRARNNNKSRRKGGGKKKSDGNKGGDEGGATADSAAASAMSAEAKEFVPPPKEGQRQKQQQGGGKRESGEQKEEESSGKKRGKRRGRGKGKKDSSKSPLRGKGTDAAGAGASDSKPPAAASGDAGASPGQPKDDKKRRQRQRRRGNKNNAATNDSDPKNNGGGKGGAGRRGGGGGSKKFSWRKQIPPGTVDPISLESLKSLKYPPFALAATAPYTPIPEWPETPSESLEQKEDEKESGKTGTSTSDIEKQQRLILEEQWGKVLTGDIMEGDDNDGTAPPADSASTAEANKRYYHLFDGRVLAYYLVSQLQFIDPMNRRDLTRDELLNLDAYLKRHRLGKAGVVEAYDARGLTVSTAGVAGQTAGGRAEILQQEAQSLLSALFSGGGGGAASSQQQGRNTAVDESNFQNEFERQYMAHERVRSQQQRQQQQRRRQGNSGRNSAGEEEDHGIYAPEQGGMLIIDDDENPGLRGGLSHAINGDTGPDTGNGLSSAVPSTLYSARHIAEMHGHGACAHADNFPALPVAASSAVVSDNGGDEGEASTTAKPAGAGAGAGGTSRSLKSISKAVKKTDPAEVARQKKAREEAQRRAALSKLSFVDPSLANASGGMDPNQGLTSGNRETFVASAGPSEGQLLRNQAMADALGVAPSTVRVNAGWARPTAAEVKLDEFGNELGVAQYPDSLILDARDKYMGELLKLERRWKMFLADDKAASHPLRPMHRELRKFVHEYSDFWRLHTESFDPEPRRYVHCVKLRDTSAPHPLLSEAVRTWRGPGTGAPLPTATVSVAASGEQRLPNGTRSLAVAPDAPIASSPINAKQVKHLELQAAGQSTTSRELTWMYEDRVPLDLAPRSVPLDAPPGAMFDLADGAGAMSSSPAERQAGDADTQPSSRFSNLHATDKRERVRLNLAPRTVPRELPEYRPPARSAYDATDAMDRARDAKQAERERQRQKEEARMAVLAEAFASDSESEDENAGGGGKAYARQRSNSSSDWEEEEALFDGSDEEE